MSKLNAEEIVGLAQASPIFGDLMKTAVNGAASFNENVPATQTAQSPGTGYPSNSEPAGVVPPGAEGAAPQEEEEYAAVPEEGAPVEEAPADTPEAVGARAAQAFLGPIMDGAMQGDPNAQEIVAKAAGSVAGAVSAQYNKSMAGSPAVAGKGAGMVPPPPPVVTTPEEDMANQIVGDQQPAAPVPPGGAPVPPNGAQVPPGAASAPPAPGGPGGEEEELDENGQPKKKKPPFPPKQ